ncbi:hypothetical protein DFH11DRAFT_1550742 [Phellopilus nigrolimitatus]|nr:hypothetical protein DFH11DRAFT_1550742 [Phellopilus nigrolimitatus]
MINNTKLVSRALLLMVAILTVTPVSAVCPDGQIGIGYEGSTPVVVANNCGIIDQKNAGDSSICGVYPSGSTVLCNAGGQVPGSAQMPDASDWGTCSGTNDSSCSGIGIHYCCALCCIGIWILKYDFLACLG